VAGDAQRATASRGAGSGFRSVFAEREFRWLWVAGVQSLVGDQLARVALSVLVFQRTDSTLLTAAVYALTFLPAFLGGLLLGGLADRYPRRRVLISCDLVRAGLVATMALPSMPLPAVGALLTLATMVGAPFKAAEPALLADIFNGERYVTALGLRTATYQSSQLAGFALGGVAVAAVGAHTALAADATSFAVSAAVLRWGLTARPAARAGAQGSAELTGSGVLEGIRLVARSRQLRLLLGLACLAGVWVMSTNSIPIMKAHARGGTDHKPQARACDLSSEVPEEEPAPHSTVSMGPPPVFSLPSQRYSQLTSWRLCH